MHIHCMYLHAAITFSIIIKKLASQSELSMGNPTVKYTISLPSMAVFVCSKSIKSAEISSSVGCIFLGWRPTKRIFLLYFDIFPLQLPDLFVRYYLILFAPILPPQEIVLRLLLQKKDFVL